MNPCRGLAAVLASGVCTLAFACSDERPDVADIDVRDATGEQRQTAGSTAEIIVQLGLAETPDRIIYTPPTSLAKPADSLATDSVRR